MQEKVSLPLEDRAVLGKKVKQLRQAGITPVHLYGPGIPSQALQAQSRALSRVLAQAGRNTPISLVIPGDDVAHEAFIREIQRDSVTGELLHVDFFQE